MALDYQAIRRDNERRYGTDIGRIGPMLLADRYDDRTHFIFELLQNAEDALARRSGWRETRSVSFDLNEHTLRVSHFGQPFDEANVRGICGIAESTKDLTAIGRFGIGFKSVYAFTDRPEVHSGAEDFGIESFVWPVAASQVERGPEETVILIPLRNGDAAGHAEIAAGLGRVGASSLLFLRQIEEVRWSVEGGRSGVYLRDAREVTSGVRRVTVVGQSQGQVDVDQEWLVFSRALTADDGLLAGHVEIAWSMMQDTEDDRERIRRIEQSPLVVFFPTVVDTHLGFLVQGPYRTTPSRDNVPRHDVWNQRCLQETAELLVESLRWLRDHSLLETGALRCLPLERVKFIEGSMFAPLFDATRNALANEPLLPSFGGGHAAARSAMLARTQELRELFSASQLTALLSSDEELTWLSGDISQDRTPELRQYLMRELDIAEVTPETILQRIDAAFLVAQTDAWILRLYEFLNGQSAMLQRAAALPLIRLADGKHVKALASDQPQAFLPGTIETSFPTVRTAVCKTEAARAFLRSLGLAEPDPVDDVVLNVLPRYRTDEVNVSDADYETDMRRILTAFATDSKGQREKLLIALRETPFVMAVYAGDAQQYVAKPGGIYLATDRLKELFAGVPGVLLADARYPCLRGEDVRDLLEPCGAVRYLRPIEDNSLSRDERRDLRHQAGHAETSGYNDHIADWMLLGLESLLATLPKLGIDGVRARARLLWEELVHLEERRGKGAFTGEYTWTHYGSYRATFDAAFVRLLNATEWVPDQHGQLQRPELVLFDSLGWKPSPFLLSKIRFKPPLIDQLAKEAGIEPGLLDLLKRLGVTSETDLRARLGMKDEPISNDGATQSEVGEALANLLGGTPQLTPPIPDPAGPEPAPSRGDRGGDAAGGDAGSAGGRTQGGSGHGSGYSGGKAKGSGQGGGKGTRGSVGGRPFISYVGAHPAAEEPDPDGLDHATRMALEEQAIEFILAVEPGLQRTPALNPGFDLFESGADGQPARWVEVKAMTGSLHDRPVGLSYTQFECAQKRGEGYWLYVVEHAGGERARVVPIQDPAGKARTFTFDHGWLGVAELDDEPEHQQD